jgi:hypothetical protein
MDDGDRNMMSVVRSEKNLINGMYRDTVRNLMQFQQRYPWNQDLVDQMLDDIDRIYPVYVKEHLAFIDRINKKGGKFNNRDLEESREIFFATYDDINEIDTKLSSMRFRESAREDRIARQEQNMPFEPLIPQLDARYMGRGRYRRYH